MGRIRSRASSAHPADRSVLSPTKQQPHKRRKKNAYKVVLESVTQKRKKLRLVATFDQQPPPGYTFIGFGNAKLTAQCKEFCRKRGELAYTVSATPKNNATADPEKISFHVNRMGFYFPNKIVDLAMEWLGIQVNGARPSSNNESSFTRGLGRRLKQHTNLSEEDQVRAAMRDLFPKMPEESLEAIVEHAFAEGAKRVGNATNLTLERRVQMAALAHVRHKHTEYDKLLKEVGYIQARKAVENPCIEKIRTWRGENLNEDDDVVEMEDDFREVIVLDDSDAGDEQHDGNVSDSESSVEYVPAPAARASLGNMTSGRPHVTSSQAPPGLGPRSLVEPESSHRLGYERLHERPVHYFTTHSQEAARSRASHRNLIQVPRAQQEYDPYIRNVPSDGPHGARIHELGGRHQAEPPVPRRDVQQDPYDDEIQLVRVARYAAEPARGQHASYHYTSGRLPVDESHGSHVVDRAEHGLRHRGEPRPEDMVVPSIEKDEPNSAPPPMSNGRPRYISHQERSFMQEPAVQRQANAHSYRRRQAEDGPPGRVPSGNVIGLTDSPGRALRDIHVGGRQPIAVESRSTGHMQPRNLHVDERYRSHRQVEPDATHRVRPVGENEPSLPYRHRLARQAEIRHECDTVSQAGTLGNGPGGLQSPSRTGDILLNAPASLRYGADQQIPERSVPLKRRSGDWMPDQLDGQDDRPSYYVRRRMDEGPVGPGRILGTADSSGPSPRPRVPERHVVNPHAGRDYHRVPSPTRMRFTRTHDDLSATGIRVQPGSSFEYRAAPGAHYYDYRPANGEAYR